MTSPLRALAPAAVWRRASRWASALGVSRVTEVTQLDRLGLPVFASVRPRGRTLCVHAGKGFDAAEARLGALVEALEIGLAEHDARLPAHGLQALDAMRASWPAGLQVAHFAPEYGAAADGLRPMPMLQAELLEHGAARARPIAVPASLLRLSLDAEPPSAPPLFSWTSNGLATGATLEEATLHAALELLERDAVALHEVHDESLYLAELPEPLRGWQEAWRRVGVELHVRYLPNVCGLACFAAWLHESGGDVNLAFGSALHPDRHVALARAVAEAAQSRLSVIHGGRDDVTAFFAKFERPDPAARRQAEALRLDRVRSARRSLHWDEVPQVHWRDVGAALAGLRARLAASGFRRMVRHRLAWPSCAAGHEPLQVVKLVVPGLEMLEPHNRRIGLRLFARMAHHGLRG